ncbi:unnamed protein product [Caenorhabditis auriculariae]|uniref:Uncharacterized protein n=1 Tax=Caenorhabditis auriculariae TaxID=2777116 RepID=A0A8S1HWC2_9PELO|nr:unnamed protein product [Caenorhabditis auriculariae]
MSFLFIYWNHPNFIDHLQEFLASRSRCAYTLPSGQAQQQRRLASSQQHLSSVVGSQQNLQQQVSSPSSTSSSFYQPPAPPPRGHYLQQQYSCPATGDRPYQQYHQQPQQQPQRHYDYGTLPYPHQGYSQSQLRASKTMIDVLAPMRSDASAGAATAAVGNLPSTANSVIEEVALRIGTQEHE